MLYDSPDGDDTSVSRRLRFDARPFRTRMYNPSVPDINRNMAAVINDIARLRLRIGNALAHTGLRIRASRQGITEVLINGHDETGTVCPVRQAGSARHIRISHILAGKIRYLLSFGASGRGRRRLLL